MTDELVSLIGRAKVYDLAQPYFVGMPHYPTHPPFLYGMTKQHGEGVLTNGGSSAAEALTLGSHVGTHIDALAHFSRDGKLHGGVPVKQSSGSGVEDLSVDTVAPILRRGLLFDMAGLAGVNELPPDFVIGPEHLDAFVQRDHIEVRKGDVVLLRTGWARCWNDPAGFVFGGTRSYVCGPGPELAGARWLSERGVFAVGSDTVGFERTPSREMAVHLHLLVERGIHIIECLNLEEIAAAGIREFLFVALPLKIRGATGSPIRPVAIA